MFRLCCPHITTNQRGSPRVGQGKEEGVCGRQAAKDAGAAVCGALMERRVA
jgi:hypothetical protein